MSCPPSGTGAIVEHGGELCCEGVRVADLAERFGTPLYVYSRATIAERFAAVRDAFGAGTHVCYAVKANGNLALIRLLGGLGAGFDVVSGGELERVRRVGMPTAGVVFAGVGKQPWEIDAALRAGVLLFNLETQDEIELLAAAGQAHGVRVPVAVRVNPDIAVGTHGYIRTGARGDKFGLDLEAAAAAVARIARTPRLELVGYHVHLGSQLRDPAPYVAAFDKVEAFVAALPERGRGVRYYDLGGGFGVAYGKPEGPLDVGALARALLPRIAANGWTPIVEPGRYLVADAGLLLTRVLGVKDAGTRRLLIVDAAMNDLLRPALYGAEHPVVAVRAGDGPVVRCDLVGPVCESGDFLAQGRELAEPRRGDLLAVLCAGAYGMAMASTYNARRRPAEVLVDGAAIRLIRRRDTLDELWAAEEP